ncbi:MAG TPA: hypothetical protein VF585_07765 [Chthoniobacterales bacterium]|jgi:hypothetical protein
MSSGRLKTFSVLSGFFLLTTSLQACPVCFAAPDSPESRGMTMAILFLLGTIGIVLCGVGSFVMYLLAKQKEPRPEAELLSATPPAHH